MTYRVEQFDLLTKSEQVRLDIEDRGNGAPNQVAFDHHKFKLSIKLFYAIF